MNDVSAAMARDARRESVRYLASADDMYAWICIDGKAFIERHFVGRLSEPFSTVDAERVADFTVGGGPRVGSVNVHVRVEPAGSLADRPSVDVHVDAVWIKPRFFADSSNAGTVMMDAKWGLWNRAAQAFEKAPD